MNVNAANTRTIIAQFSIKYNLLIVAPMYNRLTMEAAIAVPHIDEALDEELPANITEKRIS